MCIRDRSDDVLLGLNLSVNRGEIFSVVGANGSGKSTLLSVIGARLKPYSCLLYTYRL